MTTTTQALARQANGAGALVEKYRDDFAAVLPQHIKPDTFVRVAVGSLRRNPELAKAAAQDPASLLSALLDAARKGLEPGTEQYYLVPFGGSVQGIEGYQGIIERIYRAGAAQSVVVEVVRERDTFTYVPGRDERPVHKVDWFGDRGVIVGAYAYAIMRGGATSKVVVLNRQHIEDAKANSRGADRKTSPWQTNYEAMVLKTAARRLEKWVPTSSEYREELRRDTAALVGAQPATVTATSGPGRPTPPVDVDPDTGEVHDAEIVDDGQWPDTAQPGGES